METQEPKIELKRHGQCCWTLIYEEKGHTLRLYLEGWGKKFEGDDGGFINWTEPKEPIPAEKKKEILSRIEAWAQKKKMKIDFTVCKSFEEQLKEDERQGWRVERYSGGSVGVYPPPASKNFFVRFAEFLKLIRAIFF